MTITAYPVPPGMTRSSRFRVRLDGAPADVASTDAADFVTLAADGPVRVEVTAPEPVGKAVVRPLSRSIQPAVGGSTVAFSLPRPMQVSVEIEGQRPLFLFCNTPERDRPCPGTPGVHFFAAGRVHDVGQMELRAGETLYVEGGAVVRGAIHAARADGVRLCGHGILDGSCYGPSDKRRMVTLEGCRDAVVEDLVLIRPSTWMVVLGDCDRAVVRNIKEIGEVVCSDGVDVVGCRDVLIEDCFLTNNDDCVVIKSMGEPGGQRVCDWRRDVARITTRRCTFLNRGAGNIVEIGFELCTETVEDIVFEDIDVIGAHVYAAVFSIHNGDRATVRRVRYRDFRIEHYWNKLIDFRILHSRYSRDAERGRIRDVRLTGIRCVPNTYNTPSLIGGHDEAHLVENVVFEDFRIGDQPVRNADDLHLFTRQAKGIEFR